MKTHKDLDVWNEAMALAKCIYTTTKCFPKTETYSLADQMRRAAVSIPSNIAEGAARQSNKEFIQFLYIALGSCAELETQCLLAKEFGYIDEKNDSFLHLDKVGKMLNGLIRYQKKT